MAKKTKKKSCAWTRNDPDWEHFYESYIIWCDFNEVPEEERMSYHAYITANLKVLCHA